MILILSQLFIKILYTSLHAFFWQKTDIFNIFKL